MNFKHANTLHNRLLACSLAYSVNAKYNTRSTKNKQDQIKEKKITKKKKKCDKRIKIYQVFKCFFATIYL